MWIARVWALGVAAVMVLASACSSETSRDRAAASGASSSPIAAASDERAIPEPPIAPPAPSSPTFATMASPGPGGVCPEGMVLVEGTYRAYAGHRCLKWINEARDRCQEYAPPPMLSGGREEKRFCIDEYEYPNLPGVKPAVMVDWFDAKDACAVEGKRLCTSSEWTFACEGAEVRPFATGYVRDPSLCNIERPRPSPEPDFEAFGKPRKISAEVDRLDLRIASGEKPQCESSFGVHDMNGNVDEWVVNEDHFEPLPPDKEESDRPYVSGLKGGYWGPIRARCRPITSAHNAWFRFYQVGFRCCADPLDGDARGRKYDRVLPKRG